MAALWLALLLLVSCAKPGTEPVIEGNEPLMPVVTEPEELPTEPEEPEEPEPEPIPDPVLVFSAEEVEQGSFLIVRGENLDENATLTDFSGKEVPFFPVEDEKFLFLPVKPSIKVGDYTLTLKSGDFSMDYAVPVTFRAFDTQYLEVEEGTLSETLENQAANEEYNNVAAPLKYTFTPTPLWDGDFILPLTVTYKETTTYGTFRTFSNGSTEWHNAIDMAAKGGSPVYATASGTVLYAGFLKLTGNTVILDHGCGVISWYYHMKTLSVETGAGVSGGTQIGAVGTTGLSTGNHLHFGISVNGALVDPMAFVGTRPDFAFGKEGSTK